MFILSKEYLIENIIKHEENRIITAMLNNIAFYEEVKIPKKRGVRTVYNIERSSELYDMQKNLQRNFLAKVELPVCVKGFCKDTSYGDFLKEHTNKKYYMRMDIKDFFSSIKEAQIQESLKDIVKTQDAMKIIIKLCTYEGYLPQGAVTSPTLSNIVFRRIDQRILKYCQKFNITYTRYADDLLFSSNKIDFRNNKWFYKKIKYILQENGFKSNYSKRHIEQDKICLGGFVVKEEINLSRNKLKNINKILYYFKDKSKDSKYCIDKNLINDNCLSGINKMNITDSKGKKRWLTTVPELINYLCGYRSFLIGIVNSNEDTNSKKMKNLKSKIKNIEKVVKSLQINM